MCEGRRWFAVTVVLVLLGAACSTGGSGSAIQTPTTTTTRVAATTTTVDPTKAAILAAYRAHWDDVIAVTSKYPMNPLDPRLARHTTGKQLLSEQQAVTQLSLKAQYEMGTIDLSPIITSVYAETATLMDCDFDHFVEVDAHTGRPLAQPDAGHTLLRFTMSMLNGMWLVSDSTILQSGKTTDACTPNKQ